MLGGIAAPQSRTFQHLRIQTFAGSLFGAFSFLIMSMTSLTLSDFSITVELAHPLGFEFANLTKPFMLVSGMQHSLL